MGWDSIKNFVGEYAPLVGGLLGGPVGGSVGALVSAALGVDSTPDAVEQELKNNPEAVLKLKQFEMEHERELQRMTLEAETAQLKEVNATMRAEYAQEDKYVKRWRPTFGYVVAFTWAVQSVATMVGVLYAVIAEPVNAGVIINAVGAMVASLSVQWGVALSVLGVSVYKRSQDKQVAAGQAPGGFLQAIVERIKPRGG